MTGPGLDMLDCERQASTNGTHLYLRCSVGWPPPPLQHLMTFDD